MNNRATKSYFFGDYGGRFVPETLIPALVEADRVFEDARRDPAFRKELRRKLVHFVGRDTPLYPAKRLSSHYRAKIYLKREDLCHTGAHKINNTVGQALLARRMHKKRLIAETGAGQHGVATATVAAHFGFECTIYMGKEDIRRQAINVDRMRWLGARVEEVSSGSQTLKDAINEAMRDWTRTVGDTHYLFGSVLGPHPFPKMVHYFQKVIGTETRRQIRAFEHRNPDYVIACVGGGSNAIGIFSAFLNDPSVRLIGVEAGGRSNRPGQHAARFLDPKKGVLHGSYSYLLQKNGQVIPTHSVAPGLDYPMIGPEHAWLHDNQKAFYDCADDKTALKGFELLSRLEGILPALESAHAIGYLEKIRRRIHDKIVVVNLSGRGDKDLAILAETRSPNAEMKRKKRKDA